MRIKAFPELVELNPEGSFNFGFVKDFRISRSRVSLDFEDLVLVNEDYDRLMQWIYSEQGRFENVEAVVEVDSKDTNGNIVTNVYPHYLDIKDMRYDLNRATLSLQARKGTDHFFENAENLIWQVVYDDGFLTDADIVDVDYIIIPANVKMERAVATLLTISLLDQSQRIVFEWRKLIADGLDVPSGIPTTIAKIVALVAYTILVIVQLIESFNTLKELYFPKLRQFKAVSDYKLLQAGCAKLGYTFDSNELENELGNVYTMGAPFAQTGKSFLTFFQEDVIGYFNYGYPTSEDTTPTLWSLFEHYLDNYNFRIFVYDGVVKFEPKSFFQNTAQITIKQTYSDQDRREVVKTFFNSDREGKPAVWGRKYLRWQTDFSDVHSPDSSLGSQSEHISQSQNPVNADLVNLVGFSDLSMNFAWAGRKNGLTKIEEVIKGVFQFADALINTINEVREFFGANPEPSNLAAIVTNRIGVMVIEKEYFDITKKLYLVQDGNGNYRQPSNYQDLLSADTIYNTYHLDLEVPNNNFVEISMRVPFTEEKFQSTLQNNFVNLTTNGNDSEVVELLEINWKDRTAAAELTFLVADNSAFNVETIKIT